MATGFQKMKARWTDGFGALALEFAWMRGLTEAEIARAVLADPDCAISACDDVGLDASHFQTFRDARIVYLAGKLARRYGRRQVLRIAWMGLTAEGEESAASGLKQFSESMKGSGFLLYFGTFSLAASLVRFSIAERDAMEYYRHACKIIEGQVAA